MSSIIKPQRACDFEEDKLVFPLVMLPKIDGVRGVNLDGILKQRTLKPVPNRFLTDKYSKPEFLGFDGEMVLTGQERSESLCRDTTSAVRRAYGEPDIEWHLFDYLHPHVVHLPYSLRMTALARTIQDNFGFYVEAGIKIVASFVVNNLEQLLELENLWTGMGYEGAITRDPNGLHKNGRATVKSGSYLRIKRFIDFEGEVVSFEEAKENQNEATTNPLGRSERSTHQENMVPKGMIGNITKRALADVEYNGKVMIAKGQLVVVGPGKIPHDMRKHWFEHPEEFVGQVLKSKFFPRGQKEKPRFPVALTLRDMGDIVLED